MATDIVFPKNNENEFLRLAALLGYKEIVFVYKNSKDAPNLSKLKTKIKIHIAFTKKGKKKYLAVQKPKDVRNTIERKDADIIFGIETGASKDFMHHRASQLNQVLCNLAKKKKVAIGFSFEEILSSKASKRAEMFGRMSQNIKLCRKYKVKTVIASFATKPKNMRSPNDLSSLFQILGMHPADTQKSLNSL